MRGEFSTLRTELFELAVVPALTPHPVQITASLRAMPPYVPCVSYDLEATL